MLPRVGSVGDLLCWAEVGYSIGEYYSPLSQSPFCLYVSKLLGRKSCCGGDGHEFLSICDRAGETADALAQANVESTMLSERPNESWNIAKRELAAGRPLVLVNSGAVGHASLVVGLMDELMDGVSWQGLEVLDPKDGDWRQLYLRYLYNLRLRLPFFTHFSTRPKGAVKVVLPTPVMLPKPVFEETLWAEEDLMADSFEEIQLPEVPERLLRALPAMGGKGGLSLQEQKLACFPLTVTTSKNIIEGTSKKVLKGFRCFLKQPGGSRLVVDMFKRQGSYCAGRFTAGKLLDERVLELQDALRQGGRLAAKTLRFEEWADIGLDVAYLQGAGWKAGSSFQAGGFLDLGNRGKRSWMPCNFTGPHPHSKAAAYPN